MDVHDGDADDEAAIALAWADAAGRDVTTTVSGALWWCSEGAAPRAIARLHGSTVARLVERGAGPEVVAREVLLVEPLVRSLAPVAVVVDPLRIGAADASSALVDDARSHSLRVPTDSVVLLSPEGDTLEPVGEVLGGWDRAVRWTGSSVAWSQLTPQMLPVRAGRAPITEGLLLWQLTGERHEPGRRVVPDALRAFVRDVRPELAYAPTEQTGTPGLGGLPGLRRRRGGR